MSREYCHRKIACLKNHAKGQRAGGISDFGLRIADCQGKEQRGKGQALRGEEPKAVGTGSLFKIVGATPPK